MIPPSLAELFHQPYGAAAWKTLADISWAFLSLAAAKSKAWIFKCEPQFGVWSGGVSPSLESVVQASRGKTTEPLPP